VFQRFLRQQPPPSTSDVGESRAAQIEFRAYADDYVLSGLIALADGRLHEFLERVDDLAADDVTVVALDDGRGHQLDSAVIRREELCAVVATGPRGDPERRFRTRPYPMRAVIGPYTVVAYLNASPNVDARSVIHRRQIIAFTEARISFDLAGERTEHRHAALLLVRTKIEDLVSVTDHDVRLATAAGESQKLDPPGAGRLSQVPREGGSRAR
jgi:hypothetical protein